MKKLLSFLILIIVYMANTIIYSQPVLLDAFKLKENLHTIITDSIIILNIDSPEVKSVLSLYQSTETDDLKKKFEGNPFLKISDESLMNAKVDNGKDQIDKSLFSRAGSLDVTNFAFGITDFLIERTKSELNIAFFEKFKRELTKPDYEDIRTLFPQTFQMLTAIGDQMYYYNNYIQSLRHAFQTDLNRMPYNIDRLISNYENSIDPTIYKTIKLGLTTTTSIIENKHPGEILNDL